MKYKIGLVGCGRISKKHFETIKNLDNQLELTSVCDIRKDRAKKYGEKYNVPHYLDYNEMFEKEDLDLVSICTPSGTHPEVGIEAANHQVNVISEKPMAVRLNDAENFIKACDKNDVYLFVVKQNRLNPGIEALKKAIDDNRFGEIYFINSTIFWTRPQEYYDMAKWRGTWEFDGGCFMNQASHYVDLVQWFGGAVDSVSAKTATLARDIEAEDTGAAVLRFRNGALGVIQTTMLTYPQNMEGSITIIGEKGTVKIGGMALNKIEKWEFKDETEQDRKVLNSDYEPPNVYGFGHLQYYENILKVLEEGHDPSTDGREGKKSLELILAIYKSAKEGRDISIPLGYPY